VRRGQDLYRESCWQGLEQAGQVVFVSHGANWTPGVQQQYFPGALVVLDAWHLARALQEKLGAQSRLIGPLMRDALRGQPERMLARRRKLRATSSPQGRVMVADLIPYLSAISRASATCPGSAPRLRGDRETGGRGPVPAAQDPRDELVPAGSGPPAKTGCSSSTETGTATGTAAAGSGPLCGLAITLLEMLPDVAAAGSTRRQC